MGTPMSDILEAHKCSKHNFAQINKSKLIRCFFCFRTFDSPKYIIEWCDCNVNENGDMIPLEISTAVCECGVDALISVEEGYPLTDDFLKEMHAYWFSENMSFLDD